jgi:hypothetical protein
MQARKTLSFTAIIMIVVGVVLTMENLHVVSGFSIHWPVFLIVTGCGFLLVFSRKNRTDEVLLWLGTFIVSLGIFFYYLNFTSWHSLGHLWPVFLGLLGISFLSIGIVQNKLIFNVFAVAFIGLFFVFTLVFTISMQLWPMIFVVFGISLLILEYMRGNFPH